MLCTLAMGSSQSEQILPRPARMLEYASLDQVQRWSARWEIRWRPGPLPLLQVTQNSSQGLAGRGQRESLFP